jgi:hypothetical protein
MPEKQKPSTTDTTKVSAVEAKDAVLQGLSEVAVGILQERPEYIIISDVHIDSEPQNVAAALLTEIAHLSKESGVGFYVEALYNYADPAKGDLSGGVVQWDEWNTELKQRTNYRGAIQTAVGLGITTHGIDTDKKVDSESEMRMRHWTEHISKGPEAIKVLLIGAGHTWNNPQKTPDLMHRLKGLQWVISNKRSYDPPGYSKITPINMKGSTLTQQNYKLTEYTI